MSRWNNGKGYIARRRVEAFFAEWARLEQYQSALVAGFLADRGYRVPDEVRDASANLPVDALIAEQTMARSRWLDDLRAPKPCCQCGHAHAVYLSSTERGFSMLNDCVFCDCMTYRPVEVTP